MSTVESNFGAARRALLCASARCAALFTIASPLPAAPVTINIVDVAGNLALTQDAIDAYQKKHPDADRPRSTSPRRRRRSSRAS